MSKNKTINEDVVLHHNDIKSTKITWNWEIHGLCQNKNLSIQFFLDQDNLDGSRMKDVISSSVNLSIGYIKDMGTHKFNWAYVSQNPNIFPEDVIQNIHMPWNWFYLSYNPNINIDFVVRFIEQKWNWNAISSNPGILLNDISDNPTLPWCWISISRNPNLTLQFVRDNEYRINFPSLFDVCSTEIIDFYHVKVKHNPRSVNNPNITIDFIIKHPHLSLKLFNLFGNHSITFDYIEKIILKYPDYTDLYLRLLCSSSLHLEVHKQLLIIHARSMKPVFEELLQVCFDPDNMEFMNKIGVYSDVTCW